MTDLILKNQEGRYLLAEEVERKIPDLDEILVKQADLICTDVFAVAALEYIRSPKVARLFKNEVYPLELAKRMFPLKGYASLMTDYLDRIVDVDSCGPGMKINLTPRGIAKKRLFQAYFGVHSVIKKDPDLLQNMQETWQIPRYR